MKLLTFFIIFLPVVIFSQENKTTDMKIKAKSDGNIIKAKLLMKSRMTGPENYSRNKIEEDFIKHIQIETENETIVNITTSSSLSRNPVFRYKFKDDNKSKFIKFIITDNKGNIQKGSFNIKRKYQPEALSNTINNSSRSLIVNLPKIKPEVWKANSINETVYKLFGKIEAYTKGDFDVEIPALANCSDRIPIGIKSTENLETLAVFDEGTKYPAIIAFSIPPKSMIDYRFDIKKRTGKYSIVIIAKDRDGKFYKVNKKGIATYIEGLCI